MKNKYNQNFSGLYCTCHRPYPDPEDEVGVACVSGGVVSLYCH